MRAHPYSNALKCAVALLMTSCLTPISDAQPAQDPTFDGPPIGLISGLESKHPRLLFDAQRLAEIQAFYDSEAGADLRTSLSSRAKAVRGYVISASINSSEAGSQSFGTFRIPTVALHFLLTGDQDSLDSAVAHLDFLSKLDPWSTGSEVNSGMPAGNLLAGAALGYDMLYDYLEPRLRDSLRDKIWQQTRAMYYRGFLDSGNNGSAYWRDDPQNNHRFHRLGGFVLGTLVTYNGDPSQDWLLSKAIEELNFVTNYLPPDGSNHEGITYINYGHRQLLLAAWAGERTLGTPYLTTPYIKNTPLFIASSLTPGFSSRFRYADDGSSGGLNEDQLLPVLHNQLADIQALIDERNYGTSGQAWWELVIHSPKPTGGSIENLPKNISFPDLGVSFFHEGWNAGQIAAMFKCGPLGGRRLNEYRDDYDYNYINVAHDDPDANTFMIWGGESFPIEADAYAYSKRTSSHNTILVNNTGQSAQGRSDGGQWTQPATTNTSMQNMAFLTNWKNTGPIALAEGEAEGAYPTTPLTRFRRAFIWNEGKYILIFDDIRAQSNVAISWLIQSPQLTMENESTGEFLAGKGNSTDPFQFIATQPATFTIGVSTADNRNENLQYKQLKANFTNVQNLQIASLHRLWDDTLTMTLVSSDNNHATITITGPDFEDVWSWTAATDNNSAGEFSLESTSEQTFDSAPNPWRDTFPGFSYQSGVWTISDWFGAYSPKHFPWIYSARHGWMFSANSSNWFWNPELGWIWTRSNYYPWFYQYSESKWINNP